MKKLSFAGILLMLTIVAAPAVAETTVVEDAAGGALYAMFLPDGWNGDLVLYAHGFVDPEAPIALPTNDGIEALRDRLLQLGYAVAYSSFADNGLAVKEGARSTHQLRGLFVEEFGEPDRVYLMAHSLGGLVSIMLAETRPDQYDGVVPMCGMVGGSGIQADYIANVRVLFDFFYPGVLPGDALNIPEVYDLQADVILPVIQAISADPSGAGAISAIHQTPVPWSNGAELVESLVRAIGFNFRGGPDILERTHGNSPFDNLDTVYTGFLPPQVLAAVNALVDRFEDTPDAAAYMRNFYLPSGELAVPVLTLHNVLDPVVPLFHESAFQQIVAAAGESDRLVQRTVNRYGHCEFETEEMVRALQDLENWVENGVQPAP